MVAELKLYATSFVSFLLVDFIWIGLLMKGFYVEKLRPIGRISGEKFEPSLWAAGIVYVALSIGIVQFVMPKIQQDSSWLLTFGFGALLGFVVYATYDFTNYSTLKDWPLSLTLVDVAWGSVICGLVSLIAKWIRDL
jgi:uncharacterized membrane protein